MSLYFPHLHELLELHKTLGLDPFPLGNALDRAHQAMNGFAAPFQTSRTKLADLVTAVFDQAGRELVVLHEHLAAVYQLGNTFWIQFFA